jgi:hypothetical protein
MLLIYHYAVYSSIYLQVMAQFSNFLWITAFHYIIHTPLFSAMTLRLQHICAHMCEKLQETERGSSLYKMQSEHAGIHYMWHIWQESHTITVSLVHLTWSVALPGNLMELYVKRVYITKKYYWGVWHKDCVNEHVKSLFCY